MPRLAIQGGSAGGIKDKKTSKRDRRFDLFSGKGKTSKGAPLGIQKGRLLRTRKQEVNRGGPGGSSLKGVCLKGKKTTTDA